MALVQKQTSRRKLAIMYVAFFAVLGTTLYVVFFAGKGPTDIGGVADSSVDSLQKNLDRVQTVDERLLRDLEKLSDDVRFQELKPYGDLPVEVGPMGRPNPFLHL